MSADSWKEEFYSETAEDAAKRGVVAAVEHSLRKWLGALEKNLKKHEVKNLPVPFWGDTCALCHRYSLSGDPGEPDCKKCPLFMATGMACDFPKSPFRIWQVARDPRPMITALKKALAWAKKYAD